jgi:hypothetical protein
MNMVNPQLLVEATRRLWLWWIASGGRGGGGYRQGALGSGGIEFKSALAPHSSSPILTHHDIAPLSEASRTDAIAAFLVDQLCARIHVEYLTLLGRACKCVRSNAWDKSLYFTTRSFTPRCEPVNYLRLVWCRHQCRPLPMRR